MGVGRSALLKIHHGNTILRCDSLCHCHSHWDRLCFITNMSIEQTPSSKTTNWLDLQVCVFVLRDMGHEAHTTNNQTFV